MPDYENDRLRRFWGYSPEDIVQGLALIVEPHWKKQSQVILVGHDWGSYICLLYLIAYPNTVHKFVTLDIGIRDTLDLVSVCYMTYLAFVFLMSRILPDQLALLLIALYPWKFIGPCPYEVIKIISKKSYFHVIFPFHSIFFFLFRSFSSIISALQIKTDVPSNVREIKAFMCYPYFQTIIPYLPSIIFGGKDFVASCATCCLSIIFILLRQRKYLFVIYQAFLFRCLYILQKLSVPKTPTLFLFGGKKRVMFHSPSYLDALEKDPASAYKEYQDCGHWLHWTNADEVYSDILKFLNQKS